MGVGMGTGRSVGRGWRKGVLGDVKFSMWIVFGLWNFGK